MAVSALIGCSLSASVKWLVMVASATVEPYRSGRSENRSAATRASRVEKLFAERPSVREIARRTGYSRTTITRRFGVAQNPRDGDTESGAKSLSVGG